MTSIGWGGFLSSIWGRVPSTQVPALFSRFVFVCYNHPGASFMLGSEKCFVNCPHDMRAGDRMLWKDSDTDRECDCIEQMPFECKADLIDMVTKKPGAFTGSGA